MYRHCLTFFVGFPGLDELRAKKNKIMTDKENEITNRTKHESDLRELTEQLSRINDSLGRKVTAS